MAESPMQVVAVVLLILTFEGALFGAEIAERTLPKIEEPKEVDCSGFFDGVACLVRAGFNLLRVIWGVIQFLVALITFDIPEAPWYVRLIGGALIGGAILWPLVTLLRGA